LWLFQMVDNNNKFSGRLAIQQRVLPAYRSDFFDELTEVCDGGLSIFAGEVHPEESIPTTSQLHKARIVKAHNRHFLTVQSPYYFLWQDGLLEWLENWKPDTLIVEANPRYLSTSRGIRWMHERGKPVIGWGLGVPGAETQSSGLGRFFAARRDRARDRFIKQLDALIAYSHRGAEGYKAIIYPSQQVFVATNSVTKPPLGEPPARTDEFDGPPKVLFVGRLQARKRIDNLLHACASLPEDLQPILWVVGDGPVKDELKVMAGTVYPSAKFPGQKHGSELDKYFSEADLFVLPGTGGLAVQQAMASGLPIIVAEGDGTQEDLVRSGNGWLIPANDERALQEALEEALQNPQRLRKMGQASFKIVQEEINIEQMVRVFVKALNSVKMVTEPNP
jgi:glycosyltransferase involved in cell wall biosynthesis